MSRKIKIVQSLIIAYEALDDEIESLYTDGLFAVNEEDKPRLQVLLQRRYEIAQKIAEQTRL